MSLFQSKEKDGTVSILVNGYLARDPYIPDSGKIVLFGVCYGKDKYMDCKAWTSAKVGELAACLEKHDEVGVAGVLETYTDKDGKQRSQVRVDHLAIQMGAPTAPAQKETDSVAAAAQHFQELDESGEDSGGELPF